MTEKAKCKNCTDEMIEEMAKDIEHCCNRYDEEGRFVGNKCRGCEYWCDTNNLCCSFGNKEAIYLYNLGYRKIPEGSVVLSKEEYEGKEIAVEMSGGHKLRLTVGKFGEMSRVLEESTRKETAIEILSMIDKIPTNEVNELNHLRLLKINIAKQYGVEE